MRKKKRRLKFLIKKQHKNREIRVSNSAIDHYRTVYPNRKVLDMMVDLYDIMMKMVVKCEEKFIAKETYSDMSVTDDKIKLPNIPQPFEISVWTERDYDDNKLRTVIFISLKSSNINISLAQIENELTERFLRGAK